jgi:hypothetical protein
LSLIEFILIITSVVYALAIAQILSGISRLVQTEESIRWFFPHIVWIVILFISAPLTWWAGWEFRAVEWTFLKYLYTFSTPTFLFFSATLVVPQSTEGHELDLEKHFFNVRRPMLWSFFIAMLTQMYGGTVLAGEEIWSVYRIDDVAVLCGILAGALTTNKRLHAALSIWVIAYFVIVIVTQLWVPPESLSVLRN